MGCHTGFDPAKNAFTERLVHQLHHDTVEVTRIELASTALQVQFAPLDMDSQNRIAPTAGVEPASTCIDNAPAIR